MIDLTDEFLQPRPGTICHWPAGLDHPVAGTWTITIPLEPFSADDEYEPATFRPGTGGPELVTTDISLDFIKLPAAELATLSRRTFTFPVNPEDGYIDGSIYLVAAHCPVDVTRIEFGQAAPGHITATLHAYFDFDAAGGIDIHNRTADLKTILRFELGRPVSSGSP
ncbi:hypothetical protein GCM10010191_28510 [Actinomadura vinacea]|uniref:Uncharacterized protein n=1 Tax=Actinomadura vinacea TaxID=115336 RepID=A0ABN3IYZ2_9ACTN